MTLKYRPLSRPLSSDCHPDWILGVAFSILYIHRVYGGKAFSASVDHLLRYATRSATIQSAKPLMRSAIQNKRPSFRPWKRLQQSMMFPGR